MELILGGGQSALNERFHRIGGSIDAGQASVALASENGRST